MAEIKLDQLEISLLELSKAPKNKEIRNNAHVLYVQYFSELSSGKISKDCSFYKCFQQIKNHKNIERKYALVLLRCMAVDNFLPSDAEIPNFSSRIADYIQSTLPDFDKTYKWTKIRQTYEKIISMNSVFFDIEDKLKEELQIPQTVQGILECKGNVLRCLNNNFTKSFLQPYNISNHTMSIKPYFTQMDELLNCDGRDFESCFSQINESLNVYQRELENNNDFLSKFHLQSFVKKILSAVLKLESESTEMFDCEIKPKKEGRDIADKKYPFHLVDNLHKIHIPMTNSGPGIAHSVTASLSCADSLVILVDQVAFGDIPPGDFDFTIELMRQEPTRELKIDIDIRWEVASNENAKTIFMQVPLYSQDETIEWEGYQFSEPYSTEAAEGKDFVGRISNLRDLIARSRKNKIQSSYIYGQKRIGKTSLAKAVIDQLEKGKDTANIHCLYLEWGDVASTKPKSSLQRLGEAISKYLLSYQCTSNENITLSFDGTLAPLGDIAKLLYSENPDNRFLIVIDEFDEIPEPLYRLGPLAETFFTNLRAISSKPNIGFMLIGGEKMPLIMHAQGDQLNKFISEELTYFTIEEYRDYQDLVKNPTKELLTWNDDAVRSLFQATYGHAFYTKLIASKLFSRAVENKDAQISQRDLNREIDDYVCKLSVNSFAHFWKDGIQGKQEYIEAISLNRCRVFVAIGRVDRALLPRTIENIVEHERSNVLKEHEIRSIVSEDFVRREILYEENSTYLFQIPFLEKWIREVGVDKLIADTLGDKLAKELANSEEKAYVNAGEITQLIKNWPTYKGMEITSDKIRSWLSQRKKPTEQRLLFRLLEKLRFISELEIREKLKLIHARSSGSIPAWERESKRVVRRDLLVVYLDGEGKSGQYYASRYASENSISSECVISLSNFSRKSATYEKSKNVTVNGVIVVDDLAGTGNTLCKGLKSFVDTNSKYLNDRSASVIVGILACTPEAEVKITKFVESQRLGDKVKIIACEILDTESRPFSAESKIWDNDSQKQEAKALCQEIGSKLIKNNPLGFKGQGLLVAFPDRCPNNTVPLIHSSEKSHWEALLERTIR